MLTALWVHPNPYLQWGLVLGWALTAALIDVRLGRIPNPLTAVVALTGLAVAIVVGGAAGVVDGLLGCVVMALPYVLLFLVGGGAADAKLMGALGLWLGLVNGVVALLAVLIVGAVVGVCYAVARQRSQSVLGNLWQIATSVLGVAVRTHRLADVPAMLPSNAAMVPMPYGVSIFLGVAVAAAGLLTFRSGVLG